MINLRRVGIVLMTVLFGAATASLPGHAEACCGSAAPAPVAAVPALPAAPTVAMFAPSEITALPACC